MAFNLEFGKKYTVKAELVRRAEWDYGRGVLVGHVWNRIEFDQPVEALYIGFRNVYDGNIKRAYGYDQNIFERTKTHKVAMFVVNERQNPIRVEIGDVINPQD